MLCTLTLALLPAAIAPQSATATTSDASAQDLGALARRVAELEANNAELNRRLDLLSEDVEAVDLGGLFTPVGDGTRGLAPAASKVYYASSPLSIGGYGEMVYTNEQGGTGTDQLDFLRAILYVGYKFDDQWLLNTEFEFEHATVEDNNDGSGDTTPGSVSVEFAYVEYLATDNFSVRAGLLLIPMGFVNELHEPTTFFSAGRPELEQRIIPSTWRENGIGVTGSSEDFEYRVYVVNGFDAEGFSSDGLRGGRQKGGKAKAEDWAIVGRADYVGTTGLLAGVSAYHGASGQGAAGVGSVSTTIYDAHVQYQTGPLRLRGLYAMAEIDDTAALNAAFGNNVGEQMGGYYLEAGYDVLEGGDQSLTPFVRFESFDTQQGDLLGGAIDDPAGDRESWTFGLAWQPIDQVVVKADYVDADNGADSGQDLFRLSLGYIF
ncbi:porin [Engelhardtia mirabilis]|uniref:Phosphate-selective porin O and P n=1 Tax=Engelhardtia mirabilis TaxID=2528011 RepID=A0A518BHL0_9BACT|nr:hypothetical protein Pla133_15190 [Planctomycetes bacterium Pla133]QDV00771.1 hypothetical protein Pla86_15180 [Planctomycetes bacterium Pla86]